MTALWTVGGLGTAPEVALAKELLPSMIGMKRVVHRRKMLPDGRLSLVVSTEILPNTRLYMHTHPGAETTHILEGGFCSFTIQNLFADRALVVGETTKIPEGFVHGGLTGSHLTRLISSYAVHPGMPLTSPA